MQLININMSSWIAAISLFVRHYILLVFRSSRRDEHANPYAREDPAQWGESVETRNNVAWGAASDGWTGNENIPMGLISTRPASPSWQHNHSKWIPTEQREIHLDLVFCYLHKILFHQEKVKRTEGSPCNKVWLSYFNRTKP